MTHARVAAPRLNIEHHDDHHRQLPPGHDIGPEDGLHHRFDDVNREYYPRPRQRYTLRVKQTKGPA